MTTCGLIFLDDLHSFGTWISDRAPQWAQDQQLTGPLMEPTALPPPVIVVVARTLTWNLLELSKAWLAMARWILVVVDSRDSSPLPSGLTEGELAELLALERDQLAQALEQRVTFVDVDTVDVATSAGDPALDQAIHRALELAVQRAIQLASESALPSWPAPVERAPRRAAAAAGPWVEWSPPDAGARGFEEEDALRHLAAGMCWPASGPALLDATTGARIDLKTGTRTLLDGLAGSSQRWRPVAAHPLGARWLRGANGHPNTWWLEGEGGAGATSDGGWGQAIGIDPGGQLAWTGGRCHFSWRVLSQRGPALWTPSNHHWPCGHGKKLYGFKDNDPLFVQLSADGAICLSVYEHDALITPGLPLRWRQLASAPGGSDARDGFALAERMRGEPRAVLFERSDAEDTFPADPYDAHDEDARDRRAVVTVGPSDELRYVVGLEAPVYQIVGESVTRLNGEDGGHGGWCVLDAGHRITRRGSGRLLTGWDRWILIEEQGRLRREDLVSGECERLGEAEHPIRFALAFAGSPNALVVSLVVGEEGRYTGALVRLV